MDTTTHVHDWQPIPGWYARYRCASCGVIGCKFGLVNPHLRGRGTEIEPYKCQARPGGQKCDQPAVHAWRGKGFKCAAHRYPGRAARARQQLAAAKDAATQAATTPPTRTARTPPTDADAVEPPSSRT
jgi:hypothetical protein